MTGDGLREVLESFADQPQILIGVALQQAERIAELAAELSRRNEQIAELSKSLDEAEREAKRQAAPFRRPREKRSPSPGRPGRKKGHPGSYRRPPDREPDLVVDQPLPCCPNCARDLSGQPCRTLVQNILELPPVQPQFIRLTTYECDCPDCGQTVRSRHPIQVSEATGAAGTHLGPRALGIAATLSKQMGLTMRKTCRILGDMFGLDLTPGGLSQALDRVGGRLEPDYAAMSGGLRREPVVHADETSWWVGGDPWFLHVFATADTTVYQLADNRKRAVVQGVLTKEYPGVLVTDCLNIYDDATSIQHKCYGHHLVAISKAMKRHPLNGQGFLAECRGLLDAACDLKRRKPDISAEVFARNRRLLDQLASDILAEPQPSECEEEVRKRIAKQQDHLFTFLDHDGVDATNNLAERQLRPAVIARKLSCGNKTRQGARTWEILASVAATCVQRGKSFLNMVADAMPIGR